MQKTVKGTWLVDYVKLLNNFLKSNPQDREKFNELLKPGDWKYIKEMILPSSKYPYEFFQRLGNAIFIIIAQSNLETTRSFGHLVLENLLQTYKSILIPNQQIESLRKFLSFHEAYFKEVSSRAILIESAEHSAKIKLNLIPEDKQFPASKAFAYQLGGSFEALVAKAGGKKVQMEIIEDQDKNYIYNLDWK